MQFTKMQGLGNDFVVVDCFHNTIEDPENLAIRLLDRRFGIGGDGLIMALPSQVADARMRIINSDGSEANMCGNGIRCIGKFLYDTGLCRKNPLTIETLAGILILDMEVENGKVTRLTVDMGKPRFAVDEIPVAADSNRICVEVDGRKLNFFCVNTGATHAVTFDIYPEREDFLRLGPLMEHHPIFPRRANIEFCRLSENGGVDVLVWERGAGETLACGTGSCATLVAGHSLGLIGKEETIHLPGGDLSIRWAENDHLFMTGPAEISFVGQWD